MNQLRQALDSIAAIQGTKFASILSPDGFIIESSQGVNGMEEMVSAAVSEVVGLADRIGKEINIRDCREIVLRYDQLSILVEAVEDEVMLAVVLTGEGNLDPIRSAIKTSIPNLQNCIMKCV